MQDDIVFVDYEHTYNQDDLEVFKAGRQSTAWCDKIPLFIDAAAPMADNGNRVPINQESNVSWESRGHLSTTQMERRNSRGLEDIDICVR